MWQVKQKGREYKVPPFLLQKAMVEAEKRFRSRYRPETKFTDRVEIDGNFIFLAFELEKNGHDYTAILLEAKFVKK